MNGSMNGQSAPGRWSYLSIIRIAMALCVFFLFTSKMLSLVGVASVGVIILACVYCGLNRQRWRYINYTQLICYIIAAYGVLLIAKNPGVSGVYQYLQMCLLIFMHTVLMRLRMGMSDYRALRRVFVCLFWMICILYLVINGLGAFNASKAVVSPTLVKCIVPLSFFVLNMKKMPLVKLLAFAAVCLVIGERTAVFIALAIYGFYKILSSFKSAAVWRIMFFAVIAVCIALPFVYVWMSQQPWRPALDALMMQYTGGRFFSGRNIVWQVIIDGVSGSRLTGLGFGSRLLLNNDISLSAHNVYLYLYMSGGIALVALFVMLLHSIWNRYCRYRDSEYVTKTAAYFLGMLLFMDFELFLLANNIVVSLFWWITISTPFVLARKNRTINGRRPFAYVNGQRFEGTL